jgi:DNA-binding NtrC family response regulator
MVAAGQFREDLMHRLDLYRVVLPPLRERREDLEPLAERLLSMLCRRHRLPLRRLGAAARERLQAYAWPGNVRELSHELERALVFEDGEVLELRALSGTGSATSGSGLGTSAWFNPAFVFPESGFDLEEAIGRLIQHALAQSHQNVSAAARLLGVSRDYVRYRLGQLRKGEPGGG